MEWTEEQKKVIEARGSNLLVSAAAGSGKTAVLVERILSRVTDPCHPLDIDRLLIVTFTRAAASEMRSRLYDGLMKRAEARPEDLHLRRQLQLVFRAQVCTIDSFCTMVVRSFSHELDMDPAFRVGDEGELKLLRSDVVQELLEECYEGGEQGFLDFSENFAEGKEDSALEDRILRLYGFSQSAPWPERWLEDCRKVYRTEEIPALREEGWYRYYLQESKLRLQNYVKAFDRLLELCREPGGPDYCYEAFLSDRDRLEKAAGLSDFTELREALAGFRLERKPTDKKKGYDAGLQMLVKNRRDKLKKDLESFCSRFDITEEQILEELQTLRPMAEILVDLTEEFSRRFARAKQKKCIVGFEDLEHFALQILVRDGKPTEIARQLSERYEEIMIDEYQDSNEVQEQILRAVSREAEGHPNIFMVGDMKQSIYRFRMARPELFMEKYRTYGEKGEGQKIELHANFRSRSGVVTGVNSFFRQLMQESVGGIDYDENAALICRADYPETAGRTSAEPELLLLETGQGPEAGENGAEEEFSSQEREALLVASEIRRLTEEGLLVRDKEKGYRPLRYSDIVILLRSGKGWDSVFQEVLDSYGIPTYVESREGYFEAREVKLVLDLLRCIDNPIQDIPLASLMRSEIFGFTDSELALLRSGFPDREEGNGFYGALRAYSVPGKLYDKVQDLLQRLTWWRRCSGQEDLSELLRRIYRETGFLTEMTAMPGGGRRRANLEALVSKAALFEKTSYHGIYHFIRYIEKLRKYDTDEGERNTAGENEDTVRIMTIHKSKGLEFPVVFVSGLGREFNKLDERDKVILHQDFGIGMDLIDHRTRVKKRSWIRSALALKLSTEALGEELRVLYVAMTRAREKLYLTGCVKDLQKTEEDHGEGFRSGEQEVPYTELVRAESFLDWILQAYHENGPVKLRMIRTGELMAAFENGSEEDHRMTEPELRTAFSNPEASGSFGASDTDEAYRALKQVLDFDYCYDDLYRVYATMSVSALKAAYLEKKEGADKTASISGDLEMPEASVPRPAFLSGNRETAQSGAARGTLYHGIMEKIDPFLRTEAEVREALSAMEKAGLISISEKDTINPRKFVEILNSSLLERFRKACAGGKGYRERQFIIGIPVQEVLPELRLKKEREELLMIQGIVDMYFEEEDGLVVVDYKTDAVKSPAELTERYSIQLELYRKALEQTTGKKVKEKWIYSFALSKEIRL